VRTLLKITYIYWILFAVAYTWSTIINNINDCLHIEEPTILREVLIQSALTEVPVSIALIVMGISFLLIVLRTPQQFVKVLNTTKALLLRIIGSFWCVVSLCWIVLLVWPSPRVIHYFIELHEHGLGGIIYFIVTIAASVVMIFSGVLLFWITKADQQK
jgi:hypothetical protein